MTFVKICPSKALPRFGPATSEQIPFLQTCVGLSSEKKFPTQHVLVFFTRAIFWLDLLQGHIFAFPLYGIFESQVLIENPCLSSNFFRPRLLQIFLALLLQIKFHSWKCVWDWVLKRTFLTTCPGIGHQNNFLTWSFTGAPLRFPLIWYFECQGLMENPLLLSKFTWPRLLQGLGLASSEQFAFLQMHLGLSSENNFPTQHVLLFVTRASSGSTFLWAPVQFSLIWYFWISGIDGKPWLSWKWA